MPIIVEAKGLRYTITLSDDEIRIKENASFLGNFGNAMKKINVFAKDKNTLINKSYKLSEIKKATFEDVSQDTSKMVLELNEGIVQSFDMSPSDLKHSNVLKTHVKQVVDYIIDYIRAKK